MKNKVGLEYVTCAVCRHKYVGRIPKGGDGSALFPRRHTRTIPHSNAMGLTILPGTKERCPGSYEEALEYKEK